MTLIPGYRLVMDDIQPSVAYWRYSGIIEMEPDVEYAGVYALHLRQRELALDQINRPVRVTQVMGMIMVIDPMSEPETFRIESRPAWELWIVGKWNEPMAPEGWFNVERPMTWMQYAAHQLGHVLRHNVLAARLREFGIERADEQYLPFRNLSNAAERSLTLNWDELDRLLTAAGV